jgi:hypothetical protein
MKVDSEISRVFLRLNVQASTYIRRRLPILGINTSTTPLELHRQFTIGNMVTQLYIILHDI